MSFVIQEKGGSTIVFEHGCGAGIMYDYGFVWDLIYSSKFITNKKNANLAVYLVYNRQDSVSIPSSKIYK